MDIKDIGAGVTIFKDIVTILAAPAAVIAYLTYLTSVRQKRAEMLDKLYERFYEKEHYQEIRRLLDYTPAGDYERLKLALNDELDDHHLCERFVNYLNFFEHIASLEQLGQLKREEIVKLFHYYLELICRRDFVRAFVRKQGFENLDALLDEVCQSLPADKVASRAYQKWLEGGRPYGCDQQHWREAEAEIRAEMAHRRASRRSWVHRATRYILMIGRISRHRTPTKHRG
jgi:DUF2934 family protein